MHKINRADCITLCQNDGSSLLMTKDAYFYGIIDPSPKAKWPQSSARSFLNNEFRDYLSDELNRRVIEVSLSNDENPISFNPGGGNTKDSVFLLSYEEAKQYLPTKSSRIAYDFASGRPVSWWLRSVGVEEGTMMAVYRDGDMLFYEQDVDVNVCLDKLLFFVDRLHHSIKMNSLYNLVNREINKLIHYPHIIHSVERPSIAFLGPEIAGIALIAIRPAMWVEGL